MHQRSSPRRQLWMAASLPFLATGAAVAWLSGQTLETWQKVGGSLAPDGNLEILGRIPEHTTRLGLMAAAAILLGLGSIMFARPEWLRCAAETIIGLLKRLPGDMKAWLITLRGWPHDRRDGLILWIILGTALLMRTPLLDRPMFHDEAYTAVTWAPGPLRYILEDYHLPNNHIFHTMLVSWSYDLFGSQPWSVRLPAFLAALGLIPAGYGLTRRWYGRIPALVAAGILGLAPVITDYATNARGYSLFMLFSLLIFWLAARLLRQNNTVGWLLLALFAALGFWTVPMMLYPFGAVCVWLGLSAFIDPHARRVYDRSLRLIKYLIMMGILTITLTGVMYAPVMLNSGTALLFHNPFISPLSFAEFWPTLLESRGPETFVEWTRGLGYSGTAAITAGIVLGLVLHKRSGRYAIHALWAVLLWVVPILLLRRPNAWARTWSYLYPLGFIWAAAGWYALVGVIQSAAVHRERRLWGVRISLGLLIAAGLGLGFSHAQEVCPAVPCPPGDEEETVLYLLPRLEPTDLVLVESPSNAVMWYYFDQFGLPHDHFRRDLPFFRSYLLVRPIDEQTLEGVITGFGFSQEWFEMPTLSLVHTAGQIQTYRLEADRERVEMEYGIK